MAKKKEETQQKKWMLGEYCDMAEEITNIISTYDTEEEANAALDKICVLAGRAGMLYQADRYFVTDAEHAVDIEEHSGIEYSISISGVTTVEKKKKKNGKKKKKHMILAIFDDVDLDVRKEDNDVTIGKVRDVLSSISADDYEINVKRRGLCIGREYGDNEAPIPVFGDKAMVIFDMFIKGIKERGNMEVIHELFKRIGL